MQPLKWILKGVAFVALFVYLAVIIALYNLQDALVFPAPENRGDPLPTFAQAVDIVTTDNAVLRAIEIRVAKNAPYILFFHGNGALASYGLNRGKAYADAGFNVLLAEYRGYGGSTGEPSGKTILTDALQHYDWLITKGARRVFLVGHSLGTGPATFVAANRSVSALFLEAPYSSTADVAADRYPFAPVKLLFKHDIPTKDFIGNVTVPIQIMHGTRDRVIPPKFGQKLFQRAKTTDGFIEVEGARHNLVRHGSIERAIAFFKAQRGN